MGQSEYIHNVTAETFSARVIENSARVPVLVDFWASWCAPCRMLVPILEKLVAEYDGKFLLVKVNTDEERELAMQYGIRSLPTLKLFRNGEVVNEVMGVQPESVLRDLLDRYIERQSDRMIDSALTAYRHGDVEQAIAQLQGAGEADPGNDRWRVELASLFVDQRRYDEAETLLAQMPASMAAESAVSTLRSQIKFARVALDAPDEGSLRRVIASDAASSQARYQLGIVLALQGKFESALEQLLELVQRDRKFGDDAGRKAMLDVFAMIEGQDELVSRFRSRMFAALH